MSRPFKVDGLKELDAGLGGLKVTTAKGVLRRVGRKVLEPFDRAWRERAPHLWGDLDESGSVGSKITGRKGQRRESLVEVFAGPGPHPQALQQEFGNENHPAQPSVRPAWDETSPAMPGAVREELAIELEATAKRIARRTRK